MSANSITDLLIDRQLPAVLIAPVLHHGQMLGGNIHEDADEPARLWPWLPLAEMIIAVYVCDYSLHRFIPERIARFELT